MSILAYCIVCGGSIDADGGHVWLGGVEGDDLCHAVCVAEWPGQQHPRMCASARCRTPLSTDHVTLVTTVHVRRFCSVECITEGQQAHHAAVRALTPAEIGFAS